MASIPSSLEIAQAAELRPIAEVAADLGLEESDLEPYGRYKAKVDLSVLERLRTEPDGKLVFVTAITPTPAGEGKTTTAISLAEGLGLHGAKSVVCLREPSLGPVFGIKGGAAGGGYAQLVPMEDLNLHFTGDLHAITAANNLLAAVLDAHLFHGNELGIDPLTITWRRCLDMNDRSLRRVVTGSRETGFDITAASEVMAILAVSLDLADLRARLGAITVGFTPDGEPVTAEMLGAAGSMAVLLRDALKPNLIQTLEGEGALVHCGPFANTAHGTSSIVADRVGLKLADYVITEGGFGSDLGMEKFFDIVCPLAGLAPSAVVLVATVRALKHHGEDPDGGLAALEAGAANLERHLAIAAEFGLRPVVAVNRFPTDTAAELDALRRIAVERGAYAAEINDGFERGGAGAALLADTVVEAAEHPARFRPLYDRADPLESKLETIARRVYGADGVELAPTARAGLEHARRLGLDALPICMAKTHLSLSHDPSLTNAPSGFTLPIRDVRPYTGAGWLLALCGDMQTMPGLGRHPAALDIDLDPNGRIVGLF
jgi:formate--tetrahydrofolate ligase